MPIKLPKSFARRKSSGNIIEQEENTQTSSFRVFERPNPRRSLTDGGALTKRISEGHVVPALDENIFAEQPLNKNNRATYESSTSTRLSSSSTLPSSTTTPIEDQSPHARMADIPVPPPLTGALRAAAGRTFSFGGRFGKSSNPPSVRNATPDAASRHRAMTNSTDHTATPPRLTDSELHFDVEGQTDDGFGNMFDNYKRNSGREPSPQRPQNAYTSSVSHTSPEFDMERVKPAPINTDRSVPVEASPYSWGSRPSEEGLLNSPHSGESMSNIRSPVQSSTPEPATAYRRQSPAPHQMLGATTSHRSLAQRGARADPGLRRSGVYTTSDISPIDDEDAKMVRKSLLWGAQATSPPLEKGKAADSSSRPLSMEEESLFAHHGSPAPVPAPQDTDSIADNARLAVQFSESLPHTNSPVNKIMTPSQFEHYRQQQELRRSNSNASKSSEDDDEDQDEPEADEDDLEKQRLAEQQRRRQEAQLSVYRQSMMKVTGQQAPSPMLRPMTSNNSAPNLAIRNPADRSSSGKSSNDEDEETPLAILQAHGFPNRNRPPTRLANATSHPNLRGSMMQSSYSQSANSVTGGEGPRASLPPFARNLPRDPYFGASLVNPTSRESFALGGGMGGGMGSGGSMYGGSNPPQPPSGGGLINVIAQEERNRAMRRGSPNTQAIYDMGNVPRPYSGMSQQQFPQPQQITPSEQAQVQLSQSMANMMQVQMQWMQQMMHMQGGGPPPPGMMTPPMMGSPMMGNPAPMTPPPMMHSPIIGAAPAPGTPMGPPMMGGLPAVVLANQNNMMRPSSMPHHPGSAPPNMNNYEQRTLSMLDPNVSMQNAHMMSGGFRPSTPGGGYASSIAPSERSNAGLASRYRPVSTMPAEASDAPHGKGWHDENYHHSPLASSQTQPNLAKPSALATVTVRPVSHASQALPTMHRAQNGSDDENDDEAWAEMMKKRDKKKSSWKIKRGNSSLGDLLSSAVH